MAHYLLFMPDTKPADLEAAAKLAGVSSIIGGHDVLPNVEGPGGNRGLMLGWLTPQNPLMHHAAAEQTWIPSIVKTDGGRPRYWVGVWNAKPPQENELRRHYTQAGPWVKLGEQKWKLPTPDTVDSRAVYADDGTMRWEVVRQFSWLCDEAQTLRETYLQEFGLREMVFNVDPSAQIQWLLKLLQINYRMLPELAVHLDLWVGRETILDLFLTTLQLQRKPQNG